MSKKRMLWVLGLNLALSVLLGGFFACAALEVGGDFEVAPSFTYMGVRGDKEKAAEDQWIQRGATGGISDFHLFKEEKNGDYVELEGKALAGNNDYSFNFDFKKEGVGEVGFEFEQFKKYFDGTGGW